MDVFKAVQTVLAVRSFQNKPVSADVVRRIVEAGRLTASSMNGQPWHFIVVENRLVRKNAVRVDQNDFVQAVSRDLTAHVVKQFQDEISFDSNRAGTVPGLEDLREDEIREDDRRF